VGWGGEGTLKVKLGFLTPLAHKFLWVEGMRNMEEILRRLREITKEMERLRKEGYNYQQIQSLEAERRILEMLYGLLVRK
jgi:hypothetical protein